MGLRKKYVSVSLPSDLFDKFVECLPFHATPSSFLCAFISEIVKRHELEPDKPFDVILNDILLHPLKGLS